MLSWTAFWWNFLYLANFLTDTFSQHNIIWQYEQCIYKLNISTIWCLLNQRHANPHITMNLHLSFVSHFSSLLLRRKMKRIMVYLITWLSQMWVIHHVINKYIASLWLNSFGRSNPMISSCQKRLIAITILNV